jgi:hypothetical protein
MKYSKCLELMLWWIDTVLVVLRLDMQQNLPNEAASIGGKAKRDEKSLSAGKTVLARYSWAKLM